MAPTLRQKAQFYRQLYTGCKSGLQLDQILHSDFLPAPYSSFSERLGRDLRTGRTLASPLLTAKIVAHWEGCLLALGENTGQLEQVLADLAVFYEDRSRQFHALKAKLFYPFLVLLVSIVVTPLPAVVSGTLSGGAYLTGIAVRLLLVYGTYVLCLVLPFERASGSAFNPVLVFSMRWLGNTHWLRLQFEIAYLNLLTLGLGSGMDAAASLKLLQQSGAPGEYRQQHLLAMKLIEKNGLSLTRALSTSGLIKHPMVLGFLHTNEASGALHSDLKKFVLRMKDETARTAVHFVKQVGLGFYLLGLGVLLSAYL